MAAWTEKDIPDQTGKVAVVTGGNGGLGLATVKALADAGAHVLMASRNLDKAKAAKEEVLAENPEALVEIQALDLGDLTSVAEAAKALSSEHKAIDILINNAGMMALPQSETKDGFETQMGINHLGHFALTAQLLEPLNNAEAARVVAVSSVARLQGKPLTEQNIDLGDKYDAWKVYSNTKLANYHYAIALNNKFEAAGSSTRSLVAHPGLTNSDLQSTTQEHGGAGFIGALSHRMVKAIGMTTQQGALPQVRAATDPGAQGGDFFGPKFGTNGAAVKKKKIPKIKQSYLDTMWSVSEDATGVSYDF